MQLYARLIAEIMEAASSNKRLLSGASGNACLYSTIIRVKVHKDFVGFAFMNRIDTFDLNVLDIALFEQKYYEKYDVFL